MRFQTFFFLKKKTQKVDLAEGENRLHIKKSLMIFPPTRSPTLCIPQTTIRQRAEHGVNIFIFLFFQY